MMFRRGRINEAIRYFEKASSVMDTDWHNPSMLITCYQVARRNERDDEGAPDE